MISPPHVSGVLQFKEVAPFAGLKKYMTDCFTLTLERLT